jgi:hypothetical protein
MIPLGCGLWQLKVSSHNGHFSSALLITGSILALVSLSRFVLQIEELNESFLTKLTLDIGIILIANGFIFSPFPYKLPTWGIISIILSLLALAILAASCY